MSRSNKARKRSNKSKRDKYYDCPPNWWGTDLQTRHKLKRSKSTKLGDYDAVPIKQDPLTYYHVYWD